MKNRQRHPKQPVNVTVNLAVDRYKPESFFAAYVELKFYMFHGTSYTTSKNTWMIYEKCPEEGPDVKKKIAAFETEDACVAVYNKIKSELMEYLNAKFRVVAQSEREKDSIPSVSGDNSGMSIVAPESPDDPRTMPTGMDAT